MMRSREKERVLLLCALKWIKRVPFQPQKVTSKQDTQIHSKKVRQKWCHF